VLSSAVVEVSWYEEGLRSLKNDYVRFLTAPLVFISGVFSPKALVAIVIFFLLDKL